MDRRNFIRTTSAGIAASAAFSAMPLMGIARQQATYKVALIGSGWWGMNILGEAMASGRSKVVALADVDRNQLNPAIEKVEKLTGGKPKGYTNYKEMLQKEKPEIVIVATPDHWHALAAIDALNSGAHVYCEKPICHTINEGKAMVKAAQSTGKVVQIGLHRRASPHNISANEFLRSGKAGKIGSVKCFINYGGGPGQKTPDSEVPEGMDWDMYCGPAQLVPFNKTIHPRGFRQHLNFANGTISDWGVHWFDQVLWWTEEKAPKRIYSSTARRIREDSTDAADTQIAVYDFESFTLHWENRNYAGNRQEGPAVGCYFYGTEGVLHLGWTDGWTFYPVNNKKEIIHVDPVLHEPDQQNIKELWADFLKVIESKGQTINPMINGQLATNISLLAMVSAKAGRSIEWDGDKQEVINDPEANKLLSREYRKGYEYPV
jgi:predicted dehydrogenase